MASRYSLVFTPKSLKDTKKLSRPDVTKMVAKLGGLVDFSAGTLNVKKLVGVSEPTYRLRVGNMRAIFEVDKKEMVIIIVGVGYRGGVYDDL